MTATCDAPSCDRPIKGRGLCEMHLVRLRRLGAIDLQPVTGIKCEQCGSEVPPSSYGRKYCSKDCKMKRDRRVYYERHGEKVRERARNFSQSDRGQDLTLRRRYGISLADRQCLVDEQGGHCYFCPSTGPLFVDHDHETGEVRGLLCRSCNVLLGRIGDGSAELMNEILAYLRLAPTRRLS